MKTKNGGKCVRFNSLIIFHSHTEFHGHDPVQTCNRVCLQKWAPVCAIPISPFRGELRTFGNECELNNYNCDNKLSKSFVVSATIMCWCNLFPKSFSPQSINYCTTVNVSRNATTYVHVYMIHFVPCQSVELAVD